MWSLNLTDIEFGDESMIFEKPGNYKFKYSAIIDTLSSHISVPESIFSKLIKEFKKEASKNSNLYCTTHHCMSTAMNCS